MLQFGNDLLIVLEDSMPVLFAYFFGCAPGLPGAWGNSKNGYNDFVFVHFVFIRGELTGEQSPATGIVLITHSS